MPSLSGTKSELNLLISEARELAQGVDSQLAEQLTSHADRLEQAVRDLGLHYDQETPQPAIKFPSTMGSAPGEAPHPIAPPVDPDSTSEHIELDDTPLVTDDEPQAAS